MLGIHAAVAVASLETRTIGRDADETPMSRTFRTGEQVVVRVREDG
jgi:hypothetical protein